MIFIILFQSVFDDPDIIYSIDGGSPPKMFAYDLNNILPF